MKPNNTVTHRTPELNPIVRTAIKSADKSTDSSPPMVKLKAVPASGRTDSEPLFADIYVHPSTLLRAKQKGFSESFVYLMKKIALLAFDGFKPGDMVDSTMLCAEIRYGLINDKLVARTSVLGLSKGERQLAGRVIWLLADAKELPLKSLGRNSANLQQYEVK